MFSKALYKQSWKANWIAWTAVAIVMSFILVIIMGMSGGSGVGGAAGSFTDTLISASVEANFQKSALNYYYVTTDSFSQLDQKVMDKFVAVARVTAPEEIPAKFPEIVASSVSEMMNEVSLKNEELYGEFKDSEETKAEYEQYSLLTTAALTFSFDSNLVKNAIGDLYGVHENGIVPAEYDFASLANVDPTDLMTIIMTGEVPATFFDYINSPARVAYRENRALNAISVFLGGTLASDSAIETMLSSFKDSGLTITREKYDTFGFDYPGIKNISSTAIVTYQARLTLELASLAEAPSAEALKLLKANLRKDITASLIDQLPSDLQEMFNDMKDQDMYTMVVGNIFYKIIGLLFSIVFVILVGINLIAGQVDSGSMAYILSTGTKRDSVTITQSIFFVTSTILLYVVTSIVSVIVFHVSPPTFSPVTVGTILLFNLGGLMVTLALGGIMFMASAIFNRSKHAMALGGSVAVLTLVFTILGLFAGDSMPKMMRMSSLNFFNYISLATLVDFNSMLAGTTDFIWKLGILGAVMVFTYGLGIAVFRKKDLPL